MAGFSLIGYVLIKFGFEMAPMLLGFVIGTMLEEYLRRAMLLSRGDPLVFFQNPKSATMLIIAFLALAISLIPTITKTREEAFKE